MSQQAISAASVQNSAQADENVFKMKAWAENKALKKILLFISESSWNRRKGGGRRC
jgi:hypothetical protein